MKYRNVNMRDVIYLKTISYYLFTEINPKHFLKQSTGFNSHKIAIDLK